MPLIHINGVTLHVQLLGEGPPMAMIHGLFVGNLASWYFTVAPRLAPCRRLLLLDLRGHGLSERPASGYDLATLVADLAALCDSTPGFEGAIDLVGHSYGGCVAIRFALAFPARVRRLIVVDAPLPPSDEATIEALVGQRPEEVVAALPAGIRARVEAAAASERRRRRMEESLIGRRDGTTLLDDVRAEPDIGDDELASLDLPVLGVYGRGSPLRRAGGRLARAVPGARLVLLEGGHLLPSERPAELAAAIAAFLDD